MFDVGRSMFDVQAVNCSMLSVNLKFIMRQSMRKGILTKLFIMGMVFPGLAVWAVAIAQEADYNLAYSEVFGKLRRPQVSFSHETHSETLEEEGCGTCHHVQDDQSDKLVYVEGEEQPCMECHIQQKDSHKPGLREAFHGNCTVCHRRLIKNDHPKSGPTTCGGCHIKQ